MCLREKTDLPNRQPLKPNRQPILYSAAARSWLESQMIQCNVEPLYAQPDLTRPSVSSFQGTKRCCRAAGIRCSCHFVFCAWIPFGDGESQVRIETDQCQGVRMAKLFSYLELASIAMVTVDSSA